MQIRIEYSGMDQGKQMLCLENRLNNEIKGVYNLRILFKFGEISREPKGENKRRANET